MKVTMKQRVDDSNAFDATEELALKDTSYAKHMTPHLRPFREDSPYERSPENEDMEIFKVTRVDSLREGETYDLPESQAQKLIDLDYAEPA